MDYLLKNNKHYRYYLLLVIGLMLMGWWFFRLRFSGILPMSAVAFTVGAIEVRWYGIVIASSVLFGYELFVKPILKKDGIDQDKFSTFLLVLVVCSIIGARLVYVLQNTGYYFANTREMLALWHGGLSIHGAIAFGLLTSIWGSKYLRVGYLKLADVLTPAVLFGMALGRLGNFFNQEIIGYPTNVAWKMFVEASHRPVELIGYGFFHPVFLYEMLLDIILLVVLLFVRQKKPKDGTQFFLFLACYSVVRFVVEIWRYEEVRYFWHLSLAQIVSVILVVAGVVALYLLRKKK